MGKVLVGALVAGVVVFFWGAICAHGAADRDDGHPPDSRRGKSRRAR